METKLNHDNEKYRLITEHTSDLIAITTFTANPVYTYVSDSHKRTMWYASEDLIGKPSLDFIHPDDRKKLLPLLIKYINQKVKGLLTGKELEIAETVQFRVRDKAGHWHYDPRGAVAFWERMMSSKQGTAPPELLSSHPADKHRIENIQKLLPEAMNYYRPQ